MTEVRVEMELAAQPEAVFDVLADHGSYDRMRTISTSQLTRDGEVHNGTGTVRLLTKGPIRFEEEITTFERPNRLGYQILTTNIPLRHDGGLIQLEATPTGTRVLWTSTFHSTVPLLAGPTGALMATSLRRGFRRMLEDAERFARKDAADRSS